MELKSATPLNKELLQIMKKLANLNKKLDKKKQISCLNIQFDNPQLTLLQLLVNQKGVFHILLKKQ
ncbi:hypothetical protein Mapa_018129 [Marchantia paleacea]|nr:hypothetical protein Mapa_018602 [Marchantia paleacea]KAG6540446.1 hypothetical protein Mapa_018129 [Marchantia paleacea]